MNELAGDLLATALRMVGASPMMTDAVRRMVPTIIDFARRRIAEGADPAAELELMMRGAEETARVTAHEKFGV